MALRDALGRHLSPLAAGVLWWTRPALSWEGSALILASAVIHTAYYLLLDRRYRTGDLSLVYPSRAAVPAHHRGRRDLPTRRAADTARDCRRAADRRWRIVLTSNFGQLRKARSLPAMGLALLTGSMIASYTVVDKLAVAAFLVPPLFLDWATNLGRVFIMAPIALR